MKRVIISDTHIGSKYYRGNSILNFLLDSRIEYDELILGGDIIDFIKVPDFTALALEIAKAIDRNKKIVYIVGNHDTPLKGFIGKELFGIHFVNEYTFEEGGRKFKVEHGDSYDKGIVHNKFFMTILSVFHDFLERCSDWNITTWWSDWKIKRRKLRKIWDILKVNTDVDVLIMGHTHNPEFVIWGVPDGNGQIKMKTYVNSGDWVSHQTYVEIIDGVVRLRDYVEDN